MQHAIWQVASLVHVSVAVLVPSARVGLAHVPLQAPQLSKTGAASHHRVLGRHERASDAPAHLQESSTVITGRRVGAEQTSEKIEARAPGEARAPDSFSAVRPNWVSYRWSQTSENMFLVLLEPLERQSFLEVD